MKTEISPEILTIHFNWAQSAREMSGLSASLEAHGHAVERAPARASEDGARGVREKSSEGQILSFGEKVTGFREVQLYERLIISWRNPIAMSAGWALRGGREQAHVFSSLG